MRNIAVATNALIDGKMWPHLVSRVDFFVWYRLRHELQFEVNHFIEWGSYDSLTRRLQDIADNAYYSA